MEKYTKTVHIFQVWLFYERMLLTKTAVFFHIYLINFEVWQSDGTVTHLDLITINRKISYFSMTELAVIWKQEKLLWLLWLWQVWRPPGWVGYSQQEKSWVKINKTLCRRKARKLNKFQGDFRQTVDRQHVSRSSGIDTWTAAESVSEQESIKWCSHNVSWLLKVSTHFFSYSWKSDLHFAETMA